MEAKLLQALKLARMLLARAQFDHINIPAAHEIMQHVTFIDSVLKANEEESGVNIDDFVQV